MEKKKRIVIDAGHGGEDPGAIWMGRQEKDDNLRLALEIGRILEDHGVEVGYTRVTDVYQTPLEKAEIANRWGADYFISIHRNAMPIPGTASGTETLIWESGGDAERLANNINQELAQVGWTDLGTTERPGLIVLRRTQMPAVLVEAGFLDNDADNQFFEENFQQTAQAIADGILTTLSQTQGLEYYQVQVGAYENEENAKELLKKLEQEGFPVFLTEEDGRYKVRVGAYLDLDQAAWMEKMLRMEGYPTFIVKTTIDDGNFVTSPDSTRSQERR